MDAATVVDALAALAHEHRLAAFRLLVEAGPAGLPAGTIAERLGIAPSSLTFHTRELMQARLVTQRRVSRQLFYAANFDAMNDVLGYLTENCWAGEACGLECGPAGRPHVEKGAA